MREAEKKIVEQAKGEKKITETKEEKKEKKDRAQEIIQELQRVTPSHPAYEILGGIEITADVIKNDSTLCDVILDIIHKVNTDPNQYHDTAWLQKKMDQLGKVFVRKGESPEGKKADQINSKLEKLYRASQRNIDIREEELAQKITRLRKGEEIPQETNPIKFKDYGAPEQTWNQIIEGLGDDAVSQKIKQDLTIAEKTVNEASARDRPYAVQAFAETFVNAAREASQAIRPGDQQAINRYLQVQKALESKGSDFLKDYPREGGRFMEEMRKQGREYVEKMMQVDPDYRDFWFYRILENVLYNHKIDSHRELYQLYESGEMHDFLEIVRRIKTDDGQRIGLRLAERYDILKNTIFQSHDMDYYCAHPQQDMKEFIGSTSMFLNEYIDAATQDPMVSLAKRMYESALFHIRDSFGGYIPREWLAWQEGKVRASKLDDMVETYLKQAIASGQLYEVKMDPITGLPAPSMWNRKQIDPRRPYSIDELYGGETEHSEGWKRQLGELKIASALKQAKGLALVDQRLLEIISKSKGTGTSYIMDNRPWKSQGFNSIPYEGIVKYLDPVIHYYGRFGVGMDISGAFFNMIVSDSSKYDWDPGHMKILMNYYQDGEYEKAQKYCTEHNMGDIQTRLNAMDNPFGYSGMWGTMTKWRVGDATAGFDDWEKDQAYAAAVKLTNIGDTFSAPDRPSSFQKWGSTWAYIKAKQYFTEVKNPQYKEFRKQYRDRLLASNEIRYTEMARRDAEAEQNNKIDFEFEAEWRKVGINTKVGTKTYRKILDEVLANDLEHGHAKPGSELDKLTKKLERAYKARVWVQTTMKAPLIVARELNVELSKHGEKSKSRLRNRIIWELLGIDLDDLELRGGQENLTPTAIQEAAFDRISDVEGALASLQQTAIRENRNLKEKDFDDAIEKLGSSEQKQNFEKAKTYWKMVKKAMIGSEKDEDALKIYEQLGIKDAPDGSLPQGLRFHQIDWNKINAISLENINSENHFIIEELKTDLLTNKLIDRNWRHLFSTEDMGWEFLNTSALGGRNPVRRAGDLGSHVAFGQLFEEYLVNFVQRPVGKVDDMVEHLHKMFAAMSGDFQDVAAEACARVAYSTGMIYKKSDWAWKLPFGAGQIGSLFTETSISQKLHGRDRGIAWGPNDMLQWVQAVGSHILPKARYSKFTGEETMPNSEWDRARLGKFLGGTKANAMYEILNMSLFITTMLMIYQALTKKSEEEEE